MVKGHGSLQQAFVEIARAALGLQPQRFQDVVALEELVGVKAVDPLN